MQRIPGGLVSVVTLLVVLASVAWAAELRQVAPTPSAPAFAHPPRTAEERALAELDADWQARVADLVRTMKGVPDGPVLQALEQKAMQLKRDHRVAFLRLKIQFAHQRGDLATAHECEQLVLLLTNPPRPVPMSQSPVKEGGRQ